MIRESRTYFYLRKQRKTPKIYCRIKVGDEKTTSSTGINLETKYWNQDTQRAKKNAPNSNSINETLGVIESQVREAENTLRLRHEVVTLDAVTQLIENGHPTISILELFYEHNRKMKEKIEVGDIAEATYQKYKRIERQVRKFSRELYGKDDIIRTNKC